MSATMAFDRQDMHEVRNQLHLFIVAYEEALLRLTSR